MAVWAQPQGCVGQRSAFGLCGPARVRLVPCVRRLGIDAQAAKPCRRRRGHCMDAPQATAVTDSVTAARPGVPLLCCTLLRYACSTSGG